MDPSRVLLQQYLANKSEAAFGELVERHVDLVYQTALRRAGGDDALARDVAQTVFTDLAHKAAQLPPTVVLAGWLYRHTGFVAAKMIRSEQRRRQREHRAFMQNLNESSNPGQSGDAALWQRMAPFLDDALGRLSARDRDALVLRFLEGRALREVGGMLGLSENSARMRVNRALEKLRGLLQRRGVTSTAFGLGGALGLAASSPVPGGLPQSLSAAALNSAPAAAATGLAATVASLPWWGQAAAVLAMGGVVWVPVKMLAFPGPESAAAAVITEKSGAAPASVQESPPVALPAPPPVSRSQTPAPPPGPEPVVVVPPVPPEPGAPPLPSPQNSPAVAAAGVPAPPLAETAKLKLGVIPAVMQFDQKLLTVKAGQKVMLLFSNAKCPLQHNFVLVKPGTLNAAGALADKMLTDPDALTKSYLPTSPDILASSTRLLGIGQSELIQFTAPAVPGDYPYLCTFPGHWRLMNGVLRVTP